jgi:acetyl-CoA carboxylase carboxyl transferase subunit alpha
VSEQLENAIWAKIKLARHPKRPTSQTVIPLLIDGFVELFGDREYGDDHAFITGIGFFDGMPITIIAQEKGLTTEERIYRNFGMPHPEGYRKALRSMKQAEKFHRPILVLIDTPGAYPGIGAEERGQAQAIARNLFEMISIKTPIIAFVLSEGGSGGALAIGIADRVYMLENSIYSVLSPEGFASILFKDSTLAKKAAAMMKLTADDLHAFNIIDGKIKEDINGFHENIDLTIKHMHQVIKKELRHLQKLDGTTLLEQRYQKYRKMGAYQDGRPII